MSHPWPIDIDEGEPMFKLPLAALVGAAILSSASAFAQTTCTECGNTPPPTVICYGKSNAGVGNGPELYKNENGDCDPGNAYIHNQAFKNMDKPRNGKNR
jgi:hypothetical protein